MALHYAKQNLDALRPLVEGAWQETDLLRKGLHANAKKFNSAVDYYLNQSLIHPGKSIIPTRGRAI